MRKIPFVLKRIESVILALCIAIGAIFVNANAVEVLSETEEITLIPITIEY